MKPQLNTFYLLFTSVMVAGLVIVISFLYVGKSTEIQHYREHQVEMATEQAKMTALSIKRQIDLIRNQMIAFSMESFGLNKLEDFTQISSVQEALNQRFKRFFPEMYAFTIADESGRELSGDLDFLIGDICRNDLKLTARMLTAEHPYFDYHPMIHAKFGAYHFDMMIPVYVQGQKLVFFMSFMPDQLIQSLNEHRISQHDSYLVSTQVKNLIEATEHGIREKLTRPYFLTEQEVQNQIASYPVEGTKWLVSVIANPTVLDEYVHDEIQEGVVIGLFILFMWGALFIVGIRMEQQRQERIKELTNFSFHDALTGAANRRKLQHFVEHVVIGRKHETTPRALLYLDLNGFRLINDAYGHPAGDEVLISVTRRIQEALQPKDICARLGGDEFVVLINQLGHYGEDPEQAMAFIISLLEERLQRPYAVHGEIITSSCSIGGILLKGETDGFDDLLRRADKQMNRQKFKHFCDKGSSSNLE